MTHLIIAGHGKQKNGSFDPGATGVIKKGEHKYVVEDLFPAIKRHLPKGHDVVLFNKYKVSNHGNIVSLAKQYNAKQITEIHFDAATASARGGHVIIYKGYSPDKTDLALRDAIKQMVGVRYSHKGYAGISGRNDLINVNQTARAGITYRLIELGFGTNKTDADILVNKVDEYAKRLVKAITGTVNDKPSKPVSKPSKPAKKPANKPGSDYKGNSVVDYLVSKKIDSSFNNRKKLATKYGIKNYTGTASQNTQLLNKLKGGKSTGTSKPKANYPLPNGVLRRGSKGNGVKQLQRALNAANFKVGSVDGQYGAKTEDGVRRFQKVHDAYNVDGVYGSRTKARLNKVVN